MRPTYLGFRVARYGPRVTNVTDGLPGTVVVRALRKITSAQPAIAAPPANNTPTHDRTQPGDVGTDDARTQKPSRVFALIQALNIGLILCKISSWCTASRPCRGKNSSFWSFLPPKDQCMACSSSSTR